MDRWLQQDLRARIKKLTPKEQEEFIFAILGELFFDGPETEWSADTLEDINAHVTAYDLRPSEEE